jgi:Brp/Blh family beta-carotene 15,15'-monooxygenase
MVADPTQHIADITEFDGKRITLLTMALLGVKNLATVRIFNGVRIFSSAAVMSLLVASIIFSQIFESSDLRWQVIVALIALAIGIPHGALDHLVTLPRSSPLKMASFIAIYVAIALIAVWSILTWSVYGFYVVVAMSALHFGIGDAAFLAERDQILGVVKSPRPAQISYALAAGVIPVIIPLSSSESARALAEVNPDLINWDGGYANSFYSSALVLYLVAVIAQIFWRRYRDALDLTLLLALATITPPLIAFAIYFGLWHALRHTARLTLNLKKSQRAYGENESGKAFLSAVIPGLPALIGTIVIAAALVLLGDDNFSDSFLWHLLVVIWALTVPHMMVTAKLDRNALRFNR